MCGVAASKFWHEYVMLPCCCSLSLLMVGCTNPILDDGALCPTCGIGSQIQWWCSIQHGGWRISCAIHRLSSMHMDIQSNLWFMACGKCCPTLQVPLVDGVRTHTQALSYIREARTSNGASAFAGRLKVRDTIRSHLAGDVEDWASGRDLKRQQLHVRSERLIFDDGGSM